MGMARSSAPFTITRTSVMASIQLSPEVMDKWVLRKNGRIPTSKDHYLISFDSMPDDPFTQAIWSSFAPQKCKFFLWLMHRERLSTNARLHHCNMQASRQCPSCLLEEGCFHLFIACPRSTSFWNYCGIDVSSMSQTFGVEQLWLGTLCKRTMLELRVPSWHVYFEISGNVGMRRYSDKRMKQTQWSKTVQGEDLVFWSYRCSSPSDKMKIIEWSNVFPQM